MHACLCTCASHHDESAHVCWLEGYAVGSSPASAITCIAALITKAFLPTDMLQPSAQVPKYSTPLSIAPAFMYKLISFKKRCRFHTAWLHAYLQTFKHFDLDGSGAITIDELRLALEKEKDEEALQALLKQVDKNGDQKIDYDEFCEMVSLRHIVIALHGGSLRGKESLPVANSSISNNSNSAAQHILPASSIAHW